MHRAPARLALALAALSLSALAFADNRIEKTLKLAPGGEFRLDTDIGKVTVAGSPDVPGQVTGLFFPPLPTSSASAPSAFHS